MAMVCKVRSANCCSQSIVPELVNFSNLLDLLSKKLLPLPSTAILLLPVPVLKNGVAQTRFPVESNTPKIAFINAPEVIGLPPTIIVPEKVAAIKIFPFASTLIAFGLIDPPDCGLNCFTH